jgi:hypothetical protein
VVAIYLMWVLWCFGMHTLFGGFCAASGLIEGFIGVGLASIFWTQPNSVRGKK